MPSPLDPQAAALLERTRLDRPIWEYTVEDMRAKVAAGRGAQPYQAPLGTDTTIAGVPARTYAPSTGDARGALLWLHGGGWVLGDLDSCDALCQLMADEAGVRVVSAGYRLAPEHPFPAALEDTEAVLATVASETPQGEGLAVGGESAGANLATVAAQSAPENGIELAFQVLFYPVVDADFSRPSYERCVDTLPLSGERMRWYWSHYMPDVSLRRDPRISPIRHPRLDRQPPAFIAVAGHDPLHDEGIEYGERLRAAGVAVTIDAQEDLPHSYALLMAAMPRVREPVVRAAQALRRAVRAS